jgi:hypothetical protein
MKRAYKLAKLIGTPPNQCRGSNKCNNGDWPKRQTLNPTMEQSNISNLDIGAM